MKRIQFIVLTIIISGIFAACCGFKRLRDTRIKSTDGIELVEILKGKISIRYNGDYWFHKLTKNSTLNWNRSYINSLKSNKYKKPKIIFTAHTTVEPYYTSIGLVYEIIKGRSLTEIISSDLKEKFKLANFKSNVINVNGSSITKLTYELRNEKLKIDTRHIEFFLESPNKIFRIIFWTTEYNEDTFNHETESIIKTLKIDN